MYQELVEREKMKTYLDQLLLLAYVLKSLALDLCLEGGIFTCKS